MINKTQDMNEMQTRMEQMARVIHNKVGKGMRLGIMFLGMIPATVLGLVAINYDYYEYNACNPTLERDYFEIQLYSISKSLGKSILGICRGMQIINISEGGTLCQNIDTYLEHSIRKDGWIPYHSIKIKKNTILHQLLDIEEYTVSSTHHQCIKKLGMNIVASAYSADGIVEAIELCSDKQKIIGFQGHIENILTNYTEYNKIIKYILS